MPSRNVSAAMVLATVTVWGSSTGCGNAAQSSPATQVAQDDAVAVIDGVPVSRQELEASVAAQIAKLDEQAYGIRRDQLDELITTRLLAAEAKRRSRSVESLVDEEITKKAGSVSDPEIDAFKPSPRGFLRACELWDLEPADVLFVGDRPEVDAAGAAAAGMPCVIIGSAEAGLHGMNYSVVHSFERLSRVIDGS